MTYRRSRSLVLISAFLLAAIGSASVTATPPVRAPFLYINSVDSVSEELEFIEEGLNEVGEGYEPRNINNICRSKMFEVNGSYNRLTVNLKGDQIVEERLKDLQSDYEEKQWYRLPSICMELQSDVEGSRWEALADHNGSKMEIFLDQTQVREFTLRFTGFFEEDVASNKQLRPHQIFLIAGILAAIAVSALPYIFLDYDRKTRALISTLLFIVLTVIVFSIFYQWTLEAMRMKGAPL